MEKMITRILICIVVLFTTIIAFSHTVWSHGVNIIGQARAEYVYEPYPGLDSATTIQGHVERGDNPISGPGNWTWMAISLSDVPSGEDCHTGSINSSSYYVLRAGWMKYNHPAWGNGDQPYMMAAAKTISGVSLIKYGPFDQI